jgi:hypothetical protein
MAAAMVKGFDVIIVVVVNCDMAAPSFLEMVCLDCRAVRALGIQQARK